MSMSKIAPRVPSRAEELFREHQHSIYHRTDRMFAVLFGCQWLAGIGLVIWISPLTWTGRMSAVHPHVWAALGLGSLISVFPVLLALLRPGDAVTRHAIAVGQMLWSALLIHLTGGRIETHFHVFGSLAFLAFYRDWRVLLSGTVVVAADHFVRGLLWPESVYGVVVNSQWRWLEHAGWVIFEDIVLVRAILRGVKEMREIASRQEETETSSEKRYETLVNSVEGIVWEAKAGSMEFSLVSRQAEALLGYPNSKWLESRDFWKEIISQEDRLRVEVSFATKTAEAKPFEEEYRVRSATGRVVWVRNAVTVIAEEGRPVLLRGVITDITERKRLDSMKNEFISTVSHELRTPLTSIRGSLGLIAGGIGGTLTPKAKGMIDIAKKNCERLVRLVSDILDIEKIESGKMTFDIRPIEVSPLLEQAVDANRGFAQSLGVSIELVNPLNGIRVLADPDRLTQVVTNLLSNASKFSPKGGTVQLQVGWQGDNVQIAVKDQGTGIPDEFRTRIFQKFAQADSSDGRAKQGTGLGLNICKAMVERMGGRIGFDSVLGQGTTFFFDIPAQSQPLRVTTPYRPDRPSILVCEDDGDIATILRGILEGAGYNVEVASTAAQVKKQLAQNKYSGMTLDLALPDQDGISLLRELRENPATRQLPVVVVSAYMEEGRKSIKGDAFGILDWLEKPIDETKLKLALARTTAFFEGRKPRILHVEDDNDIFQVIQNALSERAEVIQSDTLNDARQRIRNEKYDLIILDITLPDGSGLELLPVLRGTPQASTPVVIFSAQEVSSRTARHVQAAFLKSKTSNQELVGTINSILESPIYTRAGELTRV